MTHEREAGIEELLIPEQEIVPELLPDIEVGSAPLSAEFTEAAEIALVTAGASVCLQMGHVPRRTGSTGAVGEQELARSVAAIVAPLLVRHGHRVTVIGADDPVPRTDVFIALHADGSTNPGAGGASVGYQNEVGREIAHAWKAAYQRRSWRFGFRPDNYTPALGGYYGVSRALQAGTRRAFIVEHGFLTNAQERAFLTSPTGHRTAAWAIVDAVGAFYGSPPERDDDAMLKAKLIRPAEGPQSAHIYVAWPSGERTYLPDFGTADQLVALGHLESTKVTTVPQRVAEMYRELKANRTGP